MRPFEYLATKEKECDKRTTVLKMTSIASKKDWKLLGHDSQYLSTADMLAITFEFQKNKKRNRTVYMLKEWDGILCPVETWTSIVIWLIYIYNTRVK